MKASSIIGAALTRCLYLKTIQIDRYLLFYTKLKSKWFKDLNIKPDTLGQVWWQMLLIPALKRQGQPDHLGSRPTWSI